MSGPKVVRVVTREEREAACRLEIGVFDQAAADLIDAAVRFHADQIELGKAIEIKRARLHALLAAGKWSEVQTHARLDERFFRSEVERIQSHVITAAEVARRKRRHLSDSAKSIVSAMDSVGCVVSTELREVPGKALTAHESSLGAMQVAIDAGLAALAATEVAKKGHDRSELANRLGVGDEAGTAARWTAPVGEMDERAVRLDGLLARIEVLADKSAAAVFTERAKAIGESSADDRSALLTDSLVLDLAKYLADMSRRETLVSGLRRTLRALEGNEAEIVSMRTKLENAIVSTDLSDASELAEEARALIARRSTKFASVARRRAVLKGLESLGYEVRETMATAWVESGRIVVTKQGVADYGVELGATPDTDQLQVRVVGAAHPVESRTAIRDMDMETKWCADFSRLQGELSRNGDSLELERALAVGEAPVKTVSTEDIERARLVDVARPRSRRMGPS